MQPEDVHCLHTFYLGTCTLVQLPTQPKYSALCNVTDTMYVKYFKFELQPSELHFKERIFSFCNKSFVDMTLRNLIIANIVSAP